MFIYADILYQNYLHMEKYYFSYMYIYIAIVKVGGFKNTNYNLEEQ